MKVQLKDINLPRLKIPDIKWPTVRKMSFDQVETQIINLNLDKFGLTLKESLTKSSEQLWNSIYKLKSFLRNF